MNILDKIKNFNWMHFNDLGKELGTLVDSVKAIASDARKLGKDASAEQIASLIVRVKALKDGSSLDELLSKILGQAESIFDEHADERAKLLEIGQKQSADLDAPQDAPKPPPVVGFPYFTVLHTDPRGDSRLSGDRYEVYQSQADLKQFYVHDGFIGGGRPNKPDAFQPFIIVGGVETGGDWKLLPR